MYVATREWERKEGERERGQPIASIMDFGRETISEPFTHTHTHNEPEKKMKGKRKRDN